MNARAVSALLLLLLAVVHAQIWIGRGSLPKVTALNAQLVAQENKNQATLRENQRLAAEVTDLREGLEMVEEKARYELGMVKPNEVFVQYATR